MILFRSGRSEGDESGFEAIGGREPYTALSQHPSIFWHWELSHVPRGLTENAEAKQIRKTNRTDILYQIEKKGSEIDPHVSNPRSS